MNAEIDGPRIVRYVTGQCASAEAVAVRRWLAEDPVRAALADELGRVWELARGSSVDWDVDRAWHDLLAARDATQAARRFAPRVLHRTLQMLPARATRRPWRWHAAAAVVLVGATALAWRLVQRPSGATPGRLTEVATRRGQRASLRLSDGTRVDLGVASALRYAPGYGGKSRDVYLEGEAYFEVTDDARRRFAVHAASAVVRDVGTKFGVRAYPDAGHVDVVVVDGVVDLRAAAPASDSLLLTAADLGQVDRAGRLSVEHGVDTAAQLGWRMGRLLFRDTPLRDALPQLSRWYDADLRLGDPALGALPLTASLRGEPLAQVLQLLTAALDVRVDRQGTAIVLYAQPRAP